MSLLLLANKILFKGSILYYHNHSGHLKARMIGGNQRSHPACHFTQYQNYFLLLQLCIARVHTRPRPHTHTHIHTHTHTHTLHCTALRLYVWEWDCAYVIFLSVLQQCLFFLFFAMVFEILRMSAYFCRHNFLARSERVWFNQSWPLARILVSYS